jgi:hypothetical protein
MCMWQWLEKVVKLMRLQVQSKVEGCSFLYVFNLQFF